MSRYSAILAGLLFCLPAAVLADTNPAGVWEGTLQTPNGDLGFVFNLHRDSAQWAAELDVPIQGLSGMPLKGVKIEGASVSIPLPGPGDPHYEGKLSEDGKTIAGTFNQGGASIPMDLKWKSEPKAVEKVQSNSGDVAILEGKWEGALEVNGNQLHLRFNFTKGSDGITGTLDSIDQGASGLPVSSISRQGDTVKLDLKIISGGFEGTLNKEGTSMAGTFTQSGANLPLTLTRQKADTK